MEARPASAAPTRASRARELWWLLLVAVPFGWLAFGGFLYAGKRAERPDWRRWGVGYLLIFWIATVLASVEQLPYSLRQAGGMVMLFGWPIAFLHGLRISPTYLRLVEGGPRTADVQPTRTRRLSRVRSAWWAIKYTPATKLWSRLPDWMPWWMAIFEPVFLAFIPWLFYEEIARNKPRWWLYYVAVLLVSVAAMGGYAWLRRRRGVVYWWETMSPTAAGLLLAVSMPLSAWFATQGVLERPLAYLSPLAQGLMLSGLIATYVYRRDLAAKGLEPRNRFPWEVPSGW